jgi:ligand-binding sensor domain-containing protein
LTQFTEKDGLSNNQVQSIQEDKSGNIWFGTGGFGVSRYDGRGFTTFTNKKNLRLSINSDKEWKITPNDLWFNAGGGVYRYDGSTLTYLPLPKTDFDTKYSKESPNRLSAYGVYCILKDRKGNLWFGTQNMGVCRYDGKHFTWLTEKGLKGPAVLGLFEDNNGNLWFGNNGYGLFQYDGKNLTNFTKEKGLSNDDFLKTLKVSDKPVQNNLARIYSINEDSNGNLWIGTIDSGVWRYDGTNLTNYTTRDGLTSNAVNVIYKDKKGELCYGTDGVGVCKFNGRFFTKFAVK